MADKTDTRLAGLTEDDVDLHPSKLCKPWCDSMCIPPLSIVSFRKVRFFFFFFSTPDVRGCLPPVHPDLGGNALRQLGNL